ncbi:MAG: RNA polymerase sigma factor [Planctomycetes bacterium]|nr:RNA polymerase sigma factor [Planctomycetota bacterium]
MTHDDDREQGSRGIPLKNPQDGEYVPDCMEAEATRLMTAAKHGDREAFESLVLALRARAFFVARSLVGSREDAMDLSQEAFLKTFRGRSTFQDDAPFLPWFHRILRNTCFSFLRKKGRIQRTSLTRLEDDAPDWDLADDTPPVSTALERDETKALFWEAMGHLSARDREILILRQFEDLSYREIAHALDVPEGTVMSRLFHARRRLRDLLEPHLSGALSDYASREGGQP